MSRFEENYRSLSLTPKLQFTLNPLYWSQLWVTLLFLLWYIVSYHFFPLAHIKWVAEDHIGENWQFALLFLAAFYSLFYLKNILVSFGMIVLALEEISWGQRLFDLKWEWLIQQNMQKSMDIHNLFPITGNRLLYVAIIGVFAVLFPLGEFIVRRFILSRYRSITLHYDYFVSLFLLGIFYVSLLNTEKYVSFYEYSEVIIYYLLFSLVMRQVRVGFLLKKRHRSTFSPVLLSLVIALSLSYFSTQNTNQYSHFSPDGLVRQALQRKEQQTWISRLLLETSLTNPKDILLTGLLPSGYSLNQLLLGHLNQVQGNQTLADSLFQSALDTARFKIVQYQWLAMMAEHRLKGQQSVNWETLKSFDSWVSIYLSSYYWSFQAMVESTLQESAPTFSTNMSPSQSSLIEYYRLLYWGK